MQRRTQSLWSRAVLTVSTFALLGAVAVARAPSSDEIALAELPAEAYLSWCRQWITACVRLLTFDGSLWVLICDEWADYFGVLLREGIIRPDELLRDEARRVRLERGGQRGGLVDVAERIDPPVERGRRAQKRNDDGEEDDESAHQKRK